MGDLHEPAPRLLAPALVDRLARMPVVVVTGARQTGKTTLVQTFPGADDRRFVTLDSLTSLDQARHEPEALARSAERLTLDEVQRAPELLLAVKRAVDQDRRRGRFLLTGSTNLLLPSRVSESLAGRATYLVLRPMTEREKRRDATPPPWPALLAAGSPGEALAALREPRVLDWRRAALEGGFPPAALAVDPDDRRVWLEGYVSTYLERDLRDLTHVSDLTAFLRFLALAAHRTGGLLNLAELARDAAIPRTTAQRWLGLLEACYLVTLLPPFVTSRAVRLVKTPKLYSADTALALHLVDVASSEELNRLPNVGALLENVVLNDLLAWRETEVRKPGVFFFRTASGVEIDFVVERGTRLLPVEVKATQSPSTDDARAIESFCAERRRQAPFGLLLYDGPEAFLLTRSTLAVPLGSVL